MKTFIDPKNGNTATATSSDPYNHDVVVKDDYGNIKEVIHYRGVTADYVKQQTSEGGFIPDKGEMF